jgi:hypothetical protein
MESQPGMSFQKIVLIVAIVLFVITLTIIGYMLKGAILNQPLVQNMQQCPDQWKFSGASGGCISTYDGSKYPNSGKFILRDLSCASSLTSFISGSTADAAASACFGSDKYWGHAEAVKDVSDSWIQGNTSNGLDTTRIYFRANGSNIDINSTLFQNKPRFITYLPSSFEENQKWAKTYGISWDAVNTDL